MNPFSRIPVTSFLIIVNLAFFLVTYLEAGAFDDSRWTWAALKLGAQFNPYTLGGQWYRVFFHMFLHANVFHLLANMYGLYSLGRELEARMGSVNFVLSYFVCGLAAACASLYFNLFKIGIGASGAVFGLFGVALVWSLSGDDDEKPIATTIINFVFFLVINLLFAQAFNADTAAHAGGLIAGVLLAVTGKVYDRYLVRTKVLYASIILAVISFFFLPRYQVDYFRFFQRLLRVEESARKAFERKEMSDDEYLAFFKLHRESWDSVRTMLAAIPYIPEELSKDTSSLRRYIALQQALNEYRIDMLEQEVYVYMDSIEIANDKLNQIPVLDYPLVMPRPDSPAAKPDSIPPRQYIKVWYDQNWNEISGPGPYYRIGYRDSLNRWQGRVWDHYANGKIQMKGSYTDDLRDGIFLYYSENDTYQSAGRYIKNRSFGKWQTFHPNGMLQREVIYDGPARIKNEWDSSGAQLVKDGYGRILEYHPNGQLALEGEIVNGFKEGLWTGYHLSGAIHFVEEYNTGLLVRGRARKENGERFVYEQNSLYPHPRDGYEVLKKYIESESAKIHSETAATVKVSFRVTSDGKLTDFEILKSGGVVLDAAAKRILAEGPRWTPALRYGYQPVDGYASVDVDF